ncbi:MAG: exopolysaccharide biosynthesis protein [Candidatus Aminicenantes bacterium]
MSEEFTSLEQLLTRICSIETKQVSLGSIIEKLGRRSFGPFLLLPGLVTLAPVIGDIPGIPTLMGAFVLLTAGQMVLQRKHVWLPGWLLRRSVSRNKLQTSIKRLLPVARFLDRMTRPRLIILTGRTGTVIIAVTCLFIGAVMPVMEVIPFSANLAGITLTVFGLSLIARDGLLALLAFICTAGIIGVGVYYLL